MWDETNGKYPSSRYPLVSRHPLARSLFTIEESFGRAPNTIDAYARGREDFFAFCAARNVTPELATKEHIAQWVGELTSRPHRRGVNVTNLHSGSGLANATLQQRVTAVRLFFDRAIEEGVRKDNPVGRGRYTPGRGFAGRRDRALIPRYKKLPWIPNGDQWEAIVTSLRVEPLRNRVMFTLAYDAALRREELCSLRISDFDFAHRLLTVRAEVTKGRSERVVPFSTTTASLLAGYFRHRRKLSLKTGPVFLSESRRNVAQPLTIWTWSKVIEGVADRTNVKQFTTHTLRHLCLTDLARSGWDELSIAQFAGHQNTQTTKLYIHLSGRDLAVKIESGMSKIHQWRLETMTPEDIF